MPDANDGDLGQALAERSADERHSSAGEEPYATVDTAPNDNTTTRVFSGDSERLSKKYEVAIGTTSIAPSSPGAPTRAERSVGQEAACQG